jgi:N-acetylglutamate synthase-like GNAT family acetyltransferase
MSIPKKQLIKAVESSLFWFPSISVQYEHLTIPGVRGFNTPLSHPLANIVGMAQWSEDGADAGIAQVINFFSSDKKNFGWITGLMSTPSDLGTRLETAGLVHAGPIAGMALTNLDVSIKTNPNLDIQVVDEGNVAVAAEVMAEGYPVPQDVAAHYINLYLNFRDHEEIRAVEYIAYLDGKPIAFANLLCSMKDKIALLSGAATLEGARGQGTYSSLVARRLADVKALGMEAAVIQAVRDTSAPICKKLGFEEICSLEFYAKMFEV